MPPSDRAQQPFLSDDAGVSEVIGYLLSLGVVTILVGVAVFGFSNAADDASERVAVLEAEAAAKRVASQVSGLALIADQHQGNVSLDLPVEDAVGSRLVRIDLDATVVWVEVPSLAVRVNATLFSADATVDVIVCDHQTMVDAVGARLRLDLWANVPDGATECVNPLGETYAIFLEAAT